MRETALVTTRALALLEGVAGVAPGPRLAPAVLLDVLARLAAGGLRVEALGGEELLLAHREGERRVAVAARELDVRVLAGLGIVGSDLVGLGLLGALDEPVPARRRETSDGVSGDGASSRHSLASAR